MLTTMADVKRFLQRHNGSLMYCTDWSKDSCPQMHTTVYTGTDLWHQFNKHTTVRIDAIVLEALDHPAIYLNIADTSKGKPWPIGNNVVLLPQTQAIVSYIGKTRDEHLAAVLGACSARWHVEAKPDDTPMIYLTAPWLYRLEDRRLA